MRRFAALFVAVLLAAPPGQVALAAAEGKIVGAVRLEGQPKSGVTVAFIELQTGAVVRAQSGADGAFETSAPVGEYAVTTESAVGLTVKQAPLRVAVVEGKTASAELELAAIASAMPSGEPPATASAPPSGSETAPPPGFANDAAPQSPYAGTTGAGAAIQFRPVTCFVAGEFPLLDAGIEPMASVARARIYFKGRQSPLYYYVEMSQEGGRYVGKLPRPFVEASPITYYLQSTTTEFEESQTVEIEAAVVATKDECGGRPAAVIGPPGPVTVFSAATGTVGAPTGFAAAAASSILVGVITAVAAGAAAAGVVGGVVAGPGQAGATPPPTAVQPIQLATPEPIVAQPTPMPITAFR